MRGTHKGHIWSTSTVSRKIVPPDPRDTYSIKKKKSHMAKTGRHSTSTGYKETNAERQPK